MINPLRLPTDWHRCKRSGPCPYLSKEELPARLSLGPDHQTHGHLLAAPGLVLLKKRAKWYLMSLTVCHK